MESESKIKPGTIETITQLRDCMISIEQCLNDIHHISDLIMVIKCRYTQFIYGAKRLMVLHVFTNNLGLASCCNWIEMSFGSICDILQIRIEMITNSEWKWSLNGNMINSGEKEVQHQQWRSAWWIAQGGQEECWWRNVEWNWGAQVQANECQWGIEKCPSSRAAHPCRVAMNGGGGVVNSIEWPQQNV